MTEISILLVQSMSRQIKGVFGQIKLFGNTFEKQKSLNRNYYFSRNIVLRPVFIS